MESNKNKFMHGYNAQGNVDELLELCEKQGFFDTYRTDYRTGRKDYDQKQFYAPFLIIFSQNEKWAIYSTTSMRSDRLKGQQWDAYNLKIIDDTIKKCYLIYPEGTSPKEKREFERKNQAIKSGEEYSSIDGIISQQSLYLEIENYVLKMKTIGQVNDLKGKSFEEFLAQVMRNSGNLDKWKCESAYATGISFPIFKEVVEGLKLKKEDIIAIKATTQVPCLPSRGKPKTDVIITVEYKNGLYKHYTISCKRTSNKKVSVHQYTAMAFSKVLDESNIKLKELLCEFQKAGNMRDFGKDNVEALTEALEPYEEKLALWVLGGYGGEGDPDTEWAHYIVTYKNNTNQCEINTIEDYYRRLKDSGVQGNFGTIFNWTYASKAKGKSIQLKTTVI